MTYRVRNPMHCVHRFVKRGKKAPRREAGSANRRLTTLKTFEARGPNSEKSEQLVEKEKQWELYR